MFGKAEFVRTNKPLTAFSAVVAIALALGGCDDIAAQHADPVRPVLVTSVHYEAQAPQRSFVGTVRPRIEADMGFRVSREGIETPCRGRCHGRHRAAARHARRGRFQAASRAGRRGIQRGDRRTGASERRRSARQRAPAEGLVDGRPIGPSESGRR